MIRSKIISSLDKCFPDADIGKLTEITRIPVLKDEYLSFQLAFRDEGGASHRRWCEVLADGDLGSDISARLVDFIPSLMPAYPGEENSDDGYITKKPGLFPDLLSPLGMNGRAPLCNFQTRTLWFETKIPRDVEPGEHHVRVRLCADDGETSENILKLDVLDAALPKQEIKVTQWLHCDCLASYYGVEVFSERHWEIIENFVKTAVKNGINTLLTPVFTPPLDTAVGGERKTVQLVKVTVTDDGYAFDYSLLDRWIEMCDRTGIEFFEISHFFTQWGAAHAPKIMAYENGVYKRIFGWESSASEGAYPEFLKAFIPDFLAHMKKNGNNSRCIFHVSDEPNSENIAQYVKSKAVVSDLLRGYLVTDALSNIAFWENGTVETPIVSVSRIGEFIEKKVPSLWAYYCCGQKKDVSNRFFAMPGARTRCIGLQMYKYGIKGFLQWGYNFYMNQYSIDPVNPYADSTGGYFVPSGDAYSVYPSDDGHALESVRIIQFREGLQDMRAMRLCESVYGKETVIREAEAVCGEIRFDKCILKSETMLEVRNKIYKMAAKIRG